MVIGKPGSNGTRLLEWYAVSIKTANPATANGLVGVGGDGSGVRALAW
jgi:hypothetical protein